MNEPSEQLLVEDNDSHIALHDMLYVFMTHTNIGIHTYFSFSHKYDPKR